MTFVILHEKTNSQEGLHILAVLFFLKKKNVLCSQVVFTFRDHIDRSYLGGSVPDLVLQIFQQDTCHHQKQIYLPCWWASSSLSFHLSQYYVFLRGAKHSYKCVLNTIIWIRSCVLQVKTLNWFVDLFACFLSYPWYCQGLLRYQSSKVSVLFSPASSKPNFHFPENHIENHHLNNSELCKYRYITASKYLFQCLFATLLRAKLWCTSLLLMMYYFTIYVLSST